MKKSLLIILVVIGFLLIGFALISKNIVNTKNNKIRTLENKLNEYCEKIFIDLEDDDEGVYQITVDEIERIFEFDISEFKKNNCSLTESFVSARFENKKMVCTPKLSC